MQRETVNSGALKSIGYDAEAGTLEVEFRTGRVYQYEGVAPETYAWLLRVENKGGFMNRMIIDRFPTREVTPYLSEGTQDLEASLRASLEPTTGGSPGGDESPP